MVGAQLARKLHLMDFLSVVISSVGLLVKGEGLFHLVVQVPSFTSSGHFTIWTLLTKLPRSILGANISAFSPSCHQPRWEKENEILVKMVADEFLQM